MRRRKIYVKSAKGSDVFATYIRRDPFGDRAAFRYPSTRSGNVQLNDDFTADYYGPAIWKYAEPRFGLWRIVKKVIGILKRTKKPVKVPA